MHATMVLFSPESCFNVADGNFGACCGHSYGPCASSCPFLWLFLWSLDMALRCFGTLVLFARPAQVSPLFESMSKSACPTVKVLLMVSSACPYIVLSFRLAPTCSTTLWGGLSKIRSRGDCEVLTSRGSVYFIGAPGGSTNTPMRPATCPRLRSIHEQRDSSACCAGQAYFCPSSAQATQSSSE